MPTLPHVRPLTSFERMALDLDAEPLLDDDLQSERQLAHGPDFMRAARATFGELLGRAAITAGRHPSGTEVKYLAQVMRDQAEVERLDVERLARAGRVTHAPTARVRLVTRIPSRTGDAVRR